MAIVLLAVGALAQHPDQLRGDLQRMQRELEQRRSESEQLLDERIRHDLGLPKSRDLEVFRAEVPATSPQIERARTSLDEEERSTANLLQRYERLAKEVERVRERKERELRQQRQAEEWLTVPAPAAEQRPVAPGRGPGPGVSVVGADARLPVPQAEPQLRVVANLPPVKAQIQGSEDRSLVAQALFRAAQALVDRGRTLAQQGHAEAAAGCDAEAKQRLLRAIADLREVTAADDAALADLFWLGRCLELTFRIDERCNGLSLRKDARDYQRREQEVREPFLRITARDVVVVDRAERLGTWGRAAQTAMEHFRWINLHGSFRPRIDLDSITWPGPEAASQR